MHAIKSRLAPTPSGFLHLGNLTSFVLTYLWINQLKGSLLLRIDDLDEQRKRANYLQDIFDTLHAIQIQWQLGPHSICDFEQNWSQQLRLNSYAETLKQLQSTGKVYACTCSRKEILAQNANGIYTGTCRHKNIPLETPNVNWRLYVPETYQVTLTDLRLGLLNLNVHTMTGDFVVRQKNRMPAYQIASLTDDINFGITHIVRGTDLLASTAAQIYIADLLGSDSFKKITWLHHPLLLNELGEKISKSAGTSSTSMLHSCTVNSNEILRKITWILWPGNQTAAMVQNMHEVVELFQTVKPAWMNA